MRHLLIRTYQSLSMLLLLSITLLMTNSSSALAQNDLPIDRHNTSGILELDSPFPTNAQSALLPASLMGMGTVKIFHAVADSDVRQIAPTQNFGTDQFMYVGYYNSIQDPILTARTFIHFNVARFLSANSNIHRATLRLKLAGTCTIGTSTVQARRVAQEWSELSITWDNQPSFAEGYGSIPIPADTQYGWYAFDVTTLVQAWVNGVYPDYGIMLLGSENPSICSLRGFRTKGGGGFTEAPELVIDYTDPATTLYLSQKDLQFQHLCNVGISPPAPQILTLQSNQAALANWTATVTQGNDWLTLNKNMGKLSRFFPDQITISVAEALPCPGVLTKQIEVVTPGLANSPQTITVTLEQRGPTLATTPDKLTFVHQCSDPLPASQLITVQSNAVTPADWTATVIGGEGWLSLNKNAGQISNTSPDQIEISVNSPPSCPSTLKAEIMIEASGHQNNPQILTVIFHHSARPTLNVSPHELAFFHQCSDVLPVSQIITVQTNAITPTNWIATVDGSAGWLNLNKNSGQISDTVTNEIEISVTQTSPCGGIATAAIQINAPDVENSPQIITVTLHQTPTHVFLPVIMHKTSIAQKQSASTSLVTPNRIILSVGIADYLYLKPPQIFTVLRLGYWGDDLLAPLSDTYAMAQVLPGNCSQCDCTTTVVLQEEQATLPNIEYALQWIDEHEDADTEVIIYFSGHGGQITDLSIPPEADGYSEMLDVYDTNDKPQFVNYLLDDSFEAQLAQLETEHLAVIIDACNSGGIQVSNPYRAVLTASLENENSWETSELEHGVFTYYMLRAMLDPTSDTNQDGWISVQELYDYAYNPVADYVAQKTGSEQHLSLDLTRDLRLVPVASGGTH